VGETVNRTFRLESSTKEISHDLVIGQETYDFLNRAAPMSEYFKPFTVRLKGYNQPAPAYATDLVHLPSLIASLDGE
jgi:class 3 adenylate cyclase